MSHQRVARDGILIDQIDALDGSPVIDIKSYFPHDDKGPVKVPDWQ
jgi:tRNA (Thr-GGU) A37 N-methylase